MMEVSLILWKLICVGKGRRGNTKEKVRKEEIEKEKDGGTTCGSLVVVVMGEVKAVVVPKVKEEENPKERKEVESQWESARIVVEKEQNEILVLCVEAMIIGVVNVQGR